MVKYHIDQTDQKILSFLVKNARMPFLEIARECGVSGAAIHQRVKRLEANGVITGSRLLVKPQAIGLNICAFISISLSEADKYNVVIAHLKKIPCQSVFDVRIAARLGFRYVEANLHPTATPGKYLVIHGYRGMLGYQVEDLEGNFAPEVVISQTPFDTLRTKYRYRSSDPQYRTPITSLEELLLECRSCGVAPMIQYVDETSLEIIRSIMGDDYISTAVAEPSGTRE